MACPNCNHTMQEVVGNEFGASWWCPRCGTLTATIGGQECDPSTPKLVERCREFEARLYHDAEPGNCQLRDAWHVSGVRESINTPDNRP